MRIIETHVRNPKPTLTMVLLLGVPWFTIEWFLLTGSPNYALGFGFLIGLASYPIFYLIYIFSINGTIIAGLAGVGLSFVTKIVIVLITGFLLSVVGTYDLHLIMPSLFYSLLSSNFFAIYFVNQ